MSSGEAPAHMHDEFAQLLVEGLPMDTELDQISHDTVELVDLTTDSETLKLYKIYRRKLQAFLALSGEYHPQRIMKFLPRAYLQENALVLSRLGRHREVLKIYLHSLRNQELAEAYCSRIYGLMTGDMAMVEQAMNVTNHLTNTTSNANNTASSNNTNNSSIVSKGGNNASMKKAFYFATSSAAAAANSASIPMNLGTPGEIYLLLFEVCFDCCLTLNLNLFRGNACTMMCINIIRLHCFCSFSIDK